MAKKTTNAPEQDANPLDRLDQAILALLRVAEIAHRAGGLCTLHLAWGSRTKRWEIDVSPGTFEEAEEIDAVRTWAGSLGSELELSAEKRTDYGTWTQRYRVLQTKGALGEATVRVFAHLDQAMLDKVSAEPAAA